MRACTAGTEKLSGLTERPILDCEGMKLKDLWVDAGALELPAGQDVEISSVAYDSRRVTQGSLFVAMPGANAATR